MTSKRASDAAKGTKGRQPEALASLEVAARHEGVKPAKQGLEATRETAPRPEDPDEKNSEATEILHRNAEADVRKRK